MSDQPICGAKPPGEPSALGCGLAAGHDRPHLSAAHEWPLEPETPAMIQPATEPQDVEGDAFALQLEHRLATSEDQANRMRETLEESTAKRLELDAELEHAKAKIRALEETLAEVIAGRDKINEVAAERAETIDAQRREIRQWVDAARFVLGIPATHPVTDRRDTPLGLKEWWTDHKTDDYHLRTDLENIEGRLRRARARLEQWRGRVQEALGDAKGYLPLAAAVALIRTLREERDDALAQVAASLEAADEPVDAVIRCGAENPDYRRVYCNREDGHDGDHQYDDGDTGVAWPRFAVVTFEGGDRDESHLYVPEVGEPCRAGTTVMVGGRYVFCGLAAKHDGPHVSPEQTEVVWR